MFRKVLLCLMIATAPARTALGMEANNAPSVQPADAAPTQDLSATPTPLEEPRPPRVEYGRPLVLPNTCRGSEGVNAFLHRLVESQRPDSGLRIEIEEIGRSAKGTPILMAAVGDDQFASKQKGGVMVIARQHGNEPAGTRAVLDLLLRVYGNREPELALLLAGVTLRMVAVANPDGMDKFSRRTANGKDMNRDWVTCSLPETQAIVRTIKRWEPDVLLDLHELSASERDQSYIAAGPVAQTGTYLDIIRLNLAKDGVSARFRKVGRGSSARLLHRNFTSRCGRPGFLVESKCPRDPAANLAGRSDYHIAAILGVVEGLSDRIEIARHKVAPKPAEPAGSAGAGW